MKRLVTPILAIAAAAAFLLSQSSIALAQSAEEKSYLAMYFTEAELTVVSATRSLKSISQVAENVHVVTATDIELMNAHTLAEVLNTVTGVQVWMIGGPGAKAQAGIQGSAERHMTVLIDGIVLNHPGSNVAEIGLIPVQNIEKIEIIKGPASSSWGSALGGVVNVITKAGSLGNSGGMLSASYGKKGTGDFRAEARGKKDRLGYYLTAGRLESDGLTSNFRVAENSAYTKLTYDITDRTGVLFAFGYDKTSRGDGVFPFFEEADENTREIAHSAVAIRSELSDNLALDLSLRTIRQKDLVKATTVGTGTSQVRNLDREYGSSVKLTWKGALQTIVIGGDFDKISVEDDALVDGKQGLRKTALYINDTIVLNKLSVTPGIRYDDTSSNGDIASPSLGIAYNLADSTVLRAYAARGFSIPALSDTYTTALNYTANPELQMQTVRSYQAGFETAALYYAWMKMSAFRNDLENPFFNQPGGVGTFTVVNREKQRRQGLEIEARTLPVYDTSVIAGAVFIDAKDLDTGEKLSRVPTQIYDLGLRYDDEQSLKALLKGRYINWNAPQSDIPDFKAAYGSFVFDLNVIKKIYQHKDSALEAFATGHNIFNGDQYLYAVYENPERWFEGGLRYSF